MTIDPLDATHRSANAMGMDIRLVEPGAGPALAVVRTRVSQPVVRAGYDVKPPRYTLTGVATFYSNGTTAMRLPRGTIVRICGPAGCVDRIVTDYGPMAGTARIVDMYRPDFFAICGCAWWSGTMEVTVGIY